MNEEIVLFEVNTFLQDFDENFARNKKLIFNYFEEGGFTLSQQKEIFDSLSTKKKCQLYNTISVDARKNYCEYLGRLKPGPEVDSKGNEIIHKDLFIRKLPDF